MKTLNGGKVLISKTLFKKIKCFYSDIFSDFKNYNDGVIVDEKEVIRLVNTLKNETRLTSINFIRKIEHLNKDDFELAYDKYTESKYKIARNKFENITGEDNLYDELITNGISLCTEMNKIKSFPAIKNHIKDMINEIKISKIFHDIKNIEEKYLRLYNSSAKLEEYEKLERNLSKIISDTYTNAITNIVDISSKDDFTLLVSEDDESCFILNKENISSATSGLILSPENNIKYASNSRSSKELLPISKLDKKDNYIEVYDFSPVAAFAITLGEKSLSKNYQKAQKLSAKYHNVPIIELDLSKFINIGLDSKIFKELIDQLLDDKNLNISKKDNDFYKSFINFYKEYKMLKAANYDESRIRNLFDVYIKLLTSREICNLDILLKEYKQIEIETVLKYNPFIDENIFRYNEVTKPLLERFIDKFYRYRLDKSLNSLYPGFSTVLTYLKNQSDDELKELVTLINNMKKIDSWLLAQTFNPMHSSVMIVKNEVESNFKEYLNNNDLNPESEKEKLLLLKDYLSSLDEKKEQENIKVA